MAVSLQAALSLVVLAFFSGICTAAVEDVAKLPSLRLLPRGLELASEAPKGDWKFQVGVELENESSWSIAWCDEGKARVTMEDSTGRNTSDVSYLYDHRSLSPVQIETLRWLPAAGAQWVRVRGEVPFGVSRHDAVTEPVTIKLTGGFSVPVVLKGGGVAGADGRPVDVKATLTVQEYGDGLEKGKRKLSLGLAADRPLGFQGFALQGMDGQPAPAREMGNCRGISKGPESWIYDWNGIWEVDAIPEGELKVTIRYAQHPRQVMAAVDFKAALSGLCEGDAGKGPLPAKAGGLVLRPETAGAVSSPVKAFGEVVAATLTGMDIRHAGKGANPLQMGFKVRLEIGKTVEFGSSREVAKQHLAVTDSTGGVLPPAIFNLAWLFPNEGDDVIEATVSGCCPGLASPGAEWVRLAGTLRVPVAQMKESPVYELPLAQGAELDVPMPGREEPVPVGGDVATIEEDPSCKLKLEKVERQENGEIKLLVFVSGEGDQFDFEHFVLVDGKGAPLQAERGGSSVRIGGSQWGHGETYTIRNAGEMQRLHLRMKYKAGTEMAPVPVDWTVGLGGPVPQKAQKLAPPKRR